MSRDYFSKNPIKNIRGRTYLILGGNNMQGVPASKIFSWPCRPRFGLKMVGDQLKLTFFYSKTLIANFRVTLVSS